MELRCVWEGYKTYTIPEGIMFVYFDRFFKPAVLDLPDSVKRLRIEYTDYSCNSFHQVDDLRLNVSCVSFLFYFFILFFSRGWSGGAMVLGKLPGRPTIWITVGQGPTALAVGAGGGCLDIFTLIYPFSPLSPSLWETARYRLKYCLKGPLNPNQPIVFQSVSILL